MIITSSVCDGKIKKKNSKYLYLQLKHYNKGAIAKRNYSFLSLLFFSLKRKFFFLSLFFLSFFSLQTCHLSPFFFWFRSFSSLPKLDLPVTSDLSPCGSNLEARWWDWSWGTVVRSISAWVGSLDYNFVLMVGCFW